MSSGSLRHRLRFFVTDAWDEWRHSPGVNLLALATLASALFLAGLVTLVLANVERSVSSLRRDVRVEVYLENGVSESSLRSIRREIEGLPGVERVAYVDPDEALRRYREWAGNMAELIAELEDNPLPASFEAYLAPGPGSEAHGEEIVKSLASRPGVEEVRFNRDWLRRLESMLELARAGGGALALIVFAAVVFVMASVLRLAVYARRDEIDIMLLVGATPAFVRGPFLVAGLVQGLLSSALALALVEAARRAALARVGAGSTALLDLVAARPLPAQASLLLCGVGLLVSLTGSYFAVRRSL